MYVRWLQETVANISIYYIIITKDESVKREICFKQCVLIVSL